MKRIDFLNQFLKPKNKVGALTPSSRYLVKKMLKPVDFSKAKLIIEFGPGNGIMTKEILRKASADCQVFSFEINDSFCGYLKKTITDKRFQIINNSAENLEHFLSENNLGKADYVISSLPLAMIPSQIVKKIIDAAYRSLKADGVMTQFQYSLNELHEFKNKFHKVRLDFTPLNIPPAFVYICRKI